VGRLIGESNTRKAKKVLMIGTLLCIGTAFAFDIFILSFTRWLAEFYSTDEVVIEHFIYVMRFFALILVFDFYQVVLAGAMRAIGNQKNWNIDCTH